MTTELRSGDRVRLLRGYNGFSSARDKPTTDEGVIFDSNYSTDSLLVQFPGWSGGHDGNPHDGVITDRWWIAPVYLEKIPTVFEPGMRVRVREDVPSGGLLAIRLNDKFSDGTPVRGFETTVAPHSRTSPTRVYIRTPSLSTVYVRPDMLEAVTEEKETAVNVELEEFKKKVWLVGMQMARRHELCDVVKDVMTEKLGLTAPGDDYPKGTVVANGEAPGRFHVARKNSRGYWGVSGSVVDKTFDEMLDSLGISADSGELRVLWTPEGN